MKKLFIVSLVIFLPALGFLFGSEAIAETYTTTFPLTENPISESGNWINGKSGGVDWNNISTTPGLAIGHQPGNVHYTDATAILTGTWGADQTVQATVYVGATYASDYPEVELRLRSSLSTHNCSGYEVYFAAVSTSAAYVAITRWNGAVGDFTRLVQHNGLQYGVATGDVVKATVVGKVIRGYKNGNLVIQATDDTFTTGNPGMGFNFDCTGVCRGSNTDYGFTSFTASDRDLSPTKNLRIFP